MPDCAGNYEILLNPSNRQKLVNNIVKFVEYFNLDGVDIDIESDLLTSLDKKGYYTPFIENLHKELKPKNKLLSCATGSYDGGMVPIKSLEFFD